MCRSVKLLQPESNGSGFIWDPVLKYIPFGNWHQLSARTSCFICCLIMRCIARNSALDLHPRFAAMDTEIQGVSFERASLSTGELVLKLEYGMQSAGALRIVTPSNCVHSSRQGWKAHTMVLRSRENLGAITDASFKPTVFDELEAQARKRRMPFHNLFEKNGPIRTLDGQEADIVQLQQWISNCDHNHGSLCNNYRGRGPRYITDVSLIVIDVVDNCLAEVTSAAKYFTLSYVWGAAEVSRTLRSNYTARLQKGGLRGNWPNTIVDAMTLVRRLQERYLWIDALCINQDDEVNLHRQIK